MRKMSTTLKSLLLAAAITFLFTACQDKQPNDPSDAPENISNEQGEEYGAKGDDRPEPTDPGESTTANTGTGTGTDTTMNRE